MENKNRLIPSVKTEVRGKYMRNKKNIMFYVLYSVLPMSEIPQKSHGRFLPASKAISNKDIPKRDAHDRISGHHRESRYLYSRFFKSANIRKPYTVIALYG